MKRLLPALLVSIVLLALLAAATNLKWSAVTGTLATLDRGAVALAFGVYAASFVGRGLRLAVLLPGAGSLPHLVSISARHIFLAVVLPFRTGEASLPLMLSAECGRPLHEGVSVLALMRILDLASVAAWLLIGLLLTGRFGASGDMALRAVAVFALLVGGLLLLPILARRAAMLANSTRKPIAFAGRAAVHLSSMQRSQFFLAALTSLATWAATYGACFLIVAAMADAPAPLGPAAAAVDFPASLIGTTGLHLSAVIPVSPLAGVGTWEAGWTAGYMTIGMDKESAATSGLVSHVLVFAFITILGGAGWLLRGRRQPAALTSAP